jgi:hypothetical protein
MGVSTNNAGVSPDSTGISPDSAGGSTDYAGISPYDAWVSTDSTGVSPNDARISPRDTRVSPKDTTMLLFQTRILPSPLTRGEFALPRTGNRFPRPSLHSPMKASGGGGRDENEVPPIFQGTSHANPEVIIIFVRQIRKQLCKREGFSSPAPADL